MTVTRLLILLLIVSLVASSPVPGKKDAMDATVLYDQRQEGGWNVRADLDNFVILLMPTQSAAASSPSSPSLLDFLTKSIPRRSHLKKNKHVKKPQKTSNNAAAEETMHHFIESKTAPYHVDISKTKSALEYPAPGLTVARVKKSSRGPKVFILTVPTVDVEESASTEELGVEGLGKTPKDELLLIGDGIEQCGPGMTRDASGICRMVERV